MSIESTENMVFSFMRRPKADLTIDFGRDSFLPGEDVHIRIHLSSNKGFDVRKGMVTLECVERFWKKEYDPATKSSRPREKSQKLAEFSSPVMNDVAVRSGIPVNAEVMFTLPVDAHRSAVGKVVKIAWQVKVSLDVQGARDLHAEEELIVLPERIEPEDRVRNERSPVFFDESFDECRLRLELPSNDYWLGEEVRGRLRLDALEECSFPEVRVELVREEEAGDQSADDVSDVVVLETDATFRSGLSREWRFDLAIPDVPMPSTSFSKSNLTWKVRAVLARSRRRDYAVETEIQVK